MMRLCKCGCGVRLRGRQTLWASEGCRKAFERGRAPANADIARTQSRSGPSGRQVSYHKAVEAAIDMLNAGTERPYEVEKLANEYMQRALPARQRAQLEQKEAA